MSGSRSGNNELYPFWMKRWSVWAPVGASQWFLSQLVDITARQAAFAHGCTRLRDAKALQPMRLGLRHGVLSTPGCYCCWRNRYSILARVHRLVTKILWLVSIIQSELRIKQWCGEINIIWCYNCRLRKIGFITDNASKVIWHPITEHDSSHFSKVSHC